MGSGLKQVYSSVNTRIFFQCFYWEIIYLIMHYTLYRPIHIPSWPNFRKNMPCFMASRYTFKFLFGALSFWHLPKDILYFTTIQAILFIYVKKKYRVGIINRTSLCYKTDLMFLFFILLQIVNYDLMYFSSHCRWWIHGNIIQKICITH